VADRLPLATNLADRRAERIRAAAVRSLRDMQDGANVAAFERHLKAGNVARAMMALDIEPRALEPVATELRDLFLESSDANLEAIANG
jgi:hypothetical protein